jgi:hypothetical protein
VATSLHAKVVPRHLGVLGNRRAVRRRRWAIGFTVSVKDTEASKSSGGTLKITQSLAFHFTVH